MTANEFFTPLAGQSLLYPGQSEIYRGQCVQSVGLWVQANGGSWPIYPSAYQYFDNGISGYSQIAKGQPIKDGDIVVWGSNFPPSGGNGHIDVASADGDINSFSAWDSNWYPPLKLSHILHNQASYNGYISGYLRKEVDVPVPIDILRIIFSEIEGADGPATHAGDNDALLIGTWGDKPVEDFIRHAWTVQPTKRHMLTAKIAELEKGMQFEQAPTLYIKKG